MTIGVYAGSFDPITKGHLAVIRQALKVVTTLHVVVAVNPD
jgi:pantetheine-phosphate adenylyltransferase